MDNTTIFVSFIRLLPHHLSDVLDDQILQQIHRLCVGILVITKAIHHTAHWGKDFFFSIDNIIMTNCMVSLYEGTGFSNESLK